MHIHTNGARADEAQNRLTLRELAMVLALVAVLFVAAGTTGHRTLNEPRRLSSIRVVEGESLWEIAEQVEVEGLTTAEKVQEIQRLNGMDGATIAAGSLVKVPASEALVDAIAMR